MPQETENKVHPFKVVLGGAVVSVVMLLISVLLGIIAVNHLEGFETWLKWREGNYLQLMLWRLTLYGGIVFAWLKLKARLPEQATASPFKRVQRIELLVLMLFVVIEISKAPITWSEVL